MDAILDYRGKTPQKTSSGVPIITAKIVKNGRIEAPNEFIATADYAGWMTRGMPKVGDIVLTTEAPLGEVAQITELPVALAQRIVTLRGKNNILDNDYLLYLAQSVEFQEQLKSRATGTTVLGIKQSELRKLELSLPPIEHQRTAASVLKALDRRAEALRSTNSVLEEISSTVFRSWFIDFDPVRAKAEGREPEGMSADIAALFPSEFVDSELGLIPKGWQVRSIGDVVECVGGGTPSTKEPAYWEGGTHNWASPKDLSGADSPILLDTAGKLTDSGLGKVSSGLLSAGTVLMSSRAPIGYLAITGMPTAINQGFIAMKASGPLPNSYLYLWAQANMEEIKSRANGSTFMEISKAAFRPIPTVIPSQSVIDAFHQLASPMFSRIESGARAAENLSDIRDLLLPRLLSGRGCVSSVIDQAVAD